MINRRWARQAITYSHDVGMAGISFLLSLYLRLGSDIVDWSHQVVVFGLVLFTAVAAGVFLWLRIDQSVWRYASLGDVGGIVRAVILTIGIFLVAQFFVTRLEDFPRSFLVINLFVLTGLLAGPRLAYRLFKDGEFSSLFDLNSQSRTPALLAGAGDGADLFIREMSRGRGRDAPYKVIGIIDDREGRIGRRIRGVPVLGGAGDLIEVVNRLAERGRPVQRIILTRAHMDGADVRQIIEGADALGLAVGRLPRLEALDTFGREGETALTPRDVKIEDLLGRPQAVLDRTLVTEFIAERRVLVTGAGGTIGGELARQVAALGPGEIALMDGSEFNLYQIDLAMNEGWPDLPRQALLGDVRDRLRVQEVMGSFRPDVVFHAAALKHVPLVEANPVDGVLTNVVGTRNVAEAAREFGVGTMVLISTDKAVNPSSVMGASKRLAEAFCQALDLEATSDAASTRFVTVRFGNVLGSTGSVIPLFQRQVARGGPLTVTHPEMTRYFMTVREAVELVLQSAALPRASADNAKGGIFVLDMGEPVRIMDLAHQVIRLSGLRPDKDIEITFTGLRPGEKLHEELFHAAETLVPTPIPGVSTAAPRTTDINLLRRALDELETAGRTRQGDVLLDQLARLVPEFERVGGTLKRGDTASG